VDSILISVVADSIDRMSGAGDYDETAETALRLLEGHREVRAAAQLYMMQQMEPPALDAVVSQFRMALGA
jgi:hypothetical protein